MTQWLKNVARLARKELFSLLRDATLMALIGFAFTLAVYSVAKGIKAEVSNASVAIVDADHSDLSRQLRAAILPPYFKPPVDVDRRGIDAALDRGAYIFALEIPPRFEADVLAGRAPAIQVLVDATAMTQAGLGAAYLQAIFTRETLAFLHARGVETAMPANAVVRVLFNPNMESFWFSSTMQIVVNITVLSIILVGAAVIREREHGTIEHLLVMPITRAEIMTAKVWSMGAVVLLASALSMIVVVRGLLGIPLQGAFALFLLGTALQLFATTAMGIFLATVAGSMPQFGLLLMMVLLPIQLLSGGSTPRESMPELVQTIMLAAPNTHFIMLAQSVLSFYFNVAVLGLCVNIAAGLLGS